MSAASTSVAHDGTKDAAAPPAPARRLSRWLWAIGVGVVVTALYTVYSAWEWSVFTVRSWDLGIFTELVQRYAAFEAPIVPIKGDGFNLLGDHFHPLLAVLGPIYAVFPHAFTLVVIQNVCFGLAAVVITRGAQRVVHPALAVAFGLAFGLSWGLQPAVEVQFHEIALAVPLLAASLVALIDRRWLAAALWAAPLVWVKEDLGFTVLAIGVVLAIRSRKAIGIWLAVWGVAWFAIATFVVLPLLSPTGRWQYSGTVNPVGMFADLSGVFAGQKFETTGLLLLVLAGIGLRSPIAAILLPTLAWRFLSTNYGYWGPTWHYSAVLMPIAFAAVLDGILLARSSRRRWLAGYARYAAIVTVVVSIALLPRLPLWVLVTPAAHEPNPRADAATAVLRAIPEGASVETDIGLMSYVAEAHATFYIGNENPDPDCILIDRVAGGTPREWGQVVEVAALRHPGSEYALVFDEDGYQLACREG